MTELASLWLGCKLLPCKFPLIWLASISIVWPLPWSWPRLQKTLHYSLLCAEGLLLVWKLTQMHEEMKCRTLYEQIAIRAQSMSKGCVGVIRSWKGIKKGKWETVRILSDPGNYISSWHTSNHFGFSDDVNWRFLTSGMSELSWFPTHFPAFRLSPWRDLLSPLPGI